jgi:D-alanine transaminase
MIYYKHQFLEKSEVHISPNDRGYYFGDGIYEVFRIYNHTLYEKDAHLRRLERSASEIGINLPKSIGEIEIILDKLLEMNGIPDGTLYLQITRGEAPRSHQFPKSVPSVMMASCTELIRPFIAMQNGITAITMEDIRWLRCDIKTLNLLPNVLAKQAAIERGVGEVILHRSGTVTECSSSNLMLVKNGILYTHPANNLILHGVTRAVVLRLAQSLGIEVKEQPFTLQELMKADEVFITGTTAEITPIIVIDGKQVNTGSPGPLTRKFQMEFERTFSQG